MRKVVAHLFMSLDGVVGLDAVMETIMKLRDTEEVLGDFFEKVAEEDAMLLGRVTYQEWADYWPTSTHEPFASHKDGKQSGSPNTGGGKIGAPVDKECLRRYTPQLKPWAGERRRCGSTESKSR
jgi:hypothetical protein